MMLLLSNPFTARSPYSCLSLYCSSLCLSASISLTSLSLSGTGWEQLEFNNAQTTMRVVLSGLLERDWPAFCCNLLAMSLGARPLGIVTLLH